MKEMVKKNSGVDWALGCSILFWIIVITTFITLISFGQTRIPHPVLEITEASASRENMIIAHRNGDPVRFANTKCIWIPDTSSPDITEGAGSLMLAGKEKKQGIVSKLEPGEKAKLEKEKPYMPKGASGIGVRLLVNFIKGFS